jgi:hypothetical protein
MHLFPKVKQAKLEANQSSPTIAAGTKIVPSRSLPTKAVLPHGNKQHLILSTDNMQLKGSCPSEEELATMLGGGERRSESAA